MSKPKFPIVASPSDYPDRVLGEASTKKQAQKLVADVLGESLDRVHIEKVGLDNLLNTTGVIFWQYTIAQAIEKPLTIEGAIALLKLPQAFDLLDLKTAYRTAAKSAHPDVEGGSTEAFLRVDRAYDLLVSQLIDQPGSTERWDAYRVKNLEKWRSLFRAEWKQVCDEGLIDPAYRHQNAFRYGLRYSTCIELFTRKYCRPLDEWFLHCVYPMPLGSSDAPSLAEIRQRYRDHLLQIAPNKLLAEAWARKYWCLEFGEPWVFYLPPAKEVAA